MKDSELEHHVPGQVKTIVYLIRQIGFNSVLVLLLMYVIFIQMEKQTDALNANTLAINQFTLTTKSFQDNVTSAHLKQTEDHTNMKTQLGVILNTKQ